ncbi:hypothetical protein [Halalkalibacter okhensis]|uniref:Uncharacterized protein n=1 Tax=Halalkalibacter okhensis TaxID=333138 RepID=A0A0B0IKR3_9BACI|nr:hypothetical protein [Halalkalibacter okhensis]KHF40256.1 hypothetical protein LQ50_10980 [Halalkalibacter okhensis]
MFFEAYLSYPLFLISLLISIVAYIGLFFIIKKENRLKYVTVLLIGIVYIFIYISLIPEPFVRSLDDVKNAYHTYTESASNIPESEIDDSSWLSTWDRAYSTLETEMFLFYTEESYFDRFFRAEFLPSSEELTEYTTLKQQVQREHMEHVEKALNAVYGAYPLHSHFNMLKENECVEHIEVMICKNDSHFTIELEETVIADPHRLQSYYVFKDVLLLIGQSSNYFLPKDKMDYTNTSLEARYDDWTYTINGDIQFED